MSRTCSWFGDNINPKVPIIGVYMVVYRGGSLCQKLIMNILEKKNENLNKNKGQKGVDSGGISWYRRVVLLVCLFEG